MLQDLTAGNVLFSLRIHMLFSPFFFGPRDSNPKGTELPDVRLTMSGTKRLCEVSMANESGCCRALAMRKAVVSHLSTD